MLVVTNLGEFNRLMVFMLHLFDLLLVALLLHYRLAQEVVLQAERLNVRNCHLNI